jgi:hypothetical protein
LTKEWDCIHGKGRGKWNEAPIKGALARLQTLIHPARLGCDTRIDLTLCEALQDEDVRKSCEQDAVDWSTGTRVGIAL